MTEELTPRRYIPFRKADVIEMCLREGRLPKSSEAPFQECCRILAALFHYEFHQVLERLKDSYAPFNPDADTRRIRNLSPQETQNHQETLLREMTRLLEAANFERITEESLKQSMAVESLFKIRLAVDFSEFEDVLFFQRGERIRQEVLTSFLGLRKRTIRFVSYDRVLVYIRFKEKAYFDARQRRNLYFKPGATIIKLFHNVPQADLEMLFPNSEVRMKPIDKLIIGIPAAVSGIIVMVSKLGASLILVASLIAFWLGLRDQPVDINQQHLVALGLGLAALGGYLFKQIGKFKNRKIRFMKALTESLYFKNLDNNAGVFHHLVDAAEEEEFKEAILAYYFLLTAGKDMNRQELDDSVEAWFEKRWNCRVNFEVGDALKKLERFGIIENRSGMIHCVSLPEALRRLDAMWDDFFDVNRRTDAARTD